jgi:hypothetical protein
LDIVIGLGGAVFVALFGGIVELDRERAFYPTLLIVIALYYVLFAAMEPSRQALVPELIVAAVFMAVAVWGFRGNLWIVAAGILAHGAQDFVHSMIVTNPGVPTWWPGFCGSIDIALAAWLGVLIVRGRIAARA